MRGGALHFLEKPFREHELWDAIQEAIALAKKRRSRATARRELDHCLAALTARERRTLTELAEGRSKEAIASEAGLCLRTVEVRRRKLMKKLGFESQIQLLRFALVAFDGHASGIPQIPEAKPKARNGRPRPKAERTVSRRPTRSLRKSKPR
jgi:FixJ family two-component response regulator